MTGQLPLIQLPPKLTDRQQLVYDHVRRHDGVPAEEVGALLHASRPGRWHHPAGERCDYCRKDGRAALRSKALKPLVTGKRDGLWHVRDQRDRVRAPVPIREPSEAELAANPFAGLDQPAQPATEAPGGLASRPERA